MGNVLFNLALVCVGTYFVSRDLQVNHVRGYISVVRTERALLMMSVSSQFGTNAAHILYLFFPFFFFLFLFNFYFVCFLFYLEMCKLHYLYFIFFSCYCIFQFVLIIACVTSFRYFTATCYYLEHFALFSSLAALFNHQFFFYFITTLFSGLFTKKIKFINQSDKFL